VDARLQLDSFSDPHLEVATAAIVSPSGPRLAGKHGLGLLSIGATMSSAGFDALGHHWSVVEERSAEFGRTADRSKWRLVSPMHLADTKDQAIRDMEFGLADWADYSQKTNSAPQFTPGGSNLKETLDWIMNDGIGVIGTVDEAIEKIEQLWEQSNGGFGCFLLLAHNWASWQATKYSYHLFATHVMPHFLKTTRRLAASEAWARSARDELAGKQADAIRAFTEKHQAKP
jgi:limonene 1,2-monooxygenase